MSLLSEVLERKPVAESVTGVKLYRIEERKGKPSFTQHFQSLKFDHKKQ